MRVTYPGKLKSRACGTISPPQPALFHPGVRLEILPDDGSPAWAELNERAHRAPVRD